MWVQSEYTLQSTMMDMLFVIRWSRLCRHFLELKESQVVLQVYSKYVLPAFSLNVLRIFLALMSFCVFGIRHVYNTFYFFLEVPSSVFVSFPETVTVVWMLMSSAF